MLLSRTLKKKNATNVESKNKQGLSSSIDDYINKTDFSGALAILQSKRRNGANDLETSLWIAYCNAHLGDYTNALKEYKKLLKNSSSSSSEIYFINALAAVCHFMLGEYEDARKLAKIAKDKGCKDESKLITRVLFHVSHKLDNSDDLWDYHSALEDRLLDQLTLASMHYMREHTNEALNVYKVQLRENPTFLALNVYVALCYYKMDYYDVSQEVLQVYLDEYPDSAIANNLKACNLFKLYSSKHAEQELRRLNEVSTSHYNFCRELINHNLVVFKNGDGAQQILPSLVGIVPEALVNLAIYYLKQDDIDEAFKLIKDVEPQTPQEYSIKGTVLAMYGQKKNSKEYLRQAHQYFQVVGASSTECDTIPGRQAMASCFFLLKQFEDVLIYLASIKMYYKDDDTFNFNYGQAKASVGKWSEAEEALSRITSEDIKNEFTYLATYIRAAIKTKQAKKAWNCYLKLDPQHPQSLDLLNILANDCYKTGQFLYSAKAFDVLERLESSEEMWEGKCGACVGIFQAVIADIEPKDSLIECLMLLRNSDNQQAEYITNIITLWAEETGLIPGEE